MNNMNNINNNNNNNKNLNREIRINEINNKIKFNNNYQ